MLLAGLTGGVGAGKSTVAMRLEARGAIIIDADAVAREVVEPGTVGLEAIRARFGRAFLTADGTLDRPALGQLVFSDDDALEDLNGIVHPLVRDVMAHRVSDLRTSGFDGVAIEMVPLLVESGRYPVDVIVVIDCEESVAIERMVANRGWTEKEARRRIAAQAGRAERRAVADYVIDNSGDEMHLDKQVASLWTWLEEQRSAS